MKSDKELADELDARDRLEKRGYKRVACTKCNGFGQFGSVVCWKCEGRGHNWQSPELSAALEEKRWVRN